MAITTAWYSTVRIVNRYGKSAPKTECLSKPGRMHLRWVIRPVVNVVHDGLVANSLNRVGDDLFMRIITIPPLPPGCGTIIIDAEIDPR